MARPLPFAGTLIALLAVGTSAAAQDRAEKFEYGVKWGYSQVAKMKLQRGCPRKGHVPTALTATSRGVAEQVHQFEVRLDSFRSSAGDTLQGRTFIREEGVPRSFQTRFHSDGRATVKKKFRDQTNTVKLKFDRPTNDLLSWWFALRGEDDLSRGASHTYYIWDGWKLARLVASVGKTERIWTPAGTFDAYRIKLKRTRLYHRGKQAYEPKSKTEKLGVMWLSTDEARTPIAMDFEAPVGVAKIRLTRAVVAGCGDE